MKFRPFYVPDTNDKELIKEHPSFDNREEAEEYIEAKCKNCSFKIGDEDYCLACYAEWWIETLVP